jgi:hypothetical protein
MKLSMTELYFRLAFDLRRNNSAKSRESLETLYEQVPGKPRLQQGIADALAGDYKQKTSARG